MRPHTMCLISIHHYSLRVASHRLPTEPCDGESGDLCKALAAPCYVAVAACERLTEGFLRLAAAAAVTMADQACRNACCWVCQSQISPHLTPDLSID